jgi:hypothetical protein
VTSEFWLRFKTQTFVETKLCFVLYIFFVMQLASNDRALLWRSRKDMQAANFFTIDIPDIGPLCVVLCTKDEAETISLCHRIAMETGGKEVWDVAVCAGYGRADYSIENVEVHDVPMYHRGRVREDGLEMFWRSCKLAALAGAAVMIHCNQSFHRGPLGLVAIMIRAGYAKHRAIEMVAEQRIIYPGHWLPFQQWPAAERQQTHSQDLLECHEWLETLGPDPAPVDHALAIQDPHFAGVGHSPDHNVDVLAPFHGEVDDGAFPDADAEDILGERQWRCSSCYVMGKKLLQCWECERWDCKKCSFWCTQCPTGKWKYTICNQCNRQENYLVRQGRVWWCSRCL